jgi:hypothetical protein
MTHDDDLCREIIKLQAGKLMPEKIQVLRSSVAVRDDDLIPTFLCVCDRLADNGKLNHRRYLVLKLMMKNNFVIETTIKKLSKQVGHWESMVSIDVAELEAVGVLRRIKTAHGFIFYLRQQR